MAAPGDLTSPTTAGGPGWPSCGHALDKHSPTSRGWGRLSVWLPILPLLQEREREREREGVGVGGRERGRGRREGGMGEGEETEGEGARRGPEGKVRHRNHPPRPLPV